MPKNIVQDGHPALRKVSTPVGVADIGNAEIQKTLSDMVAALHSQVDGVAIAAPQIGVNLRIFIVNGALLHDANPKKFKDNTDQIYINPVIIKRSTKQEWKAGEGCLSCRWLYGTVKRHNNVTIEAYDEHGTKFTRGAGGLLAHIFQHEVDHLDGILFVDKAKNIEEILPEDQEDGGISLEHNHKH